MDNLTEITREKLEESYDKIKQKEKELKNIFVQCNNYDELVSMRNLLESNEDCCITVRSFDTGRELSFEIKASPDEKKCKNNLLKFIENENKKLKDILETFIKY